VPNMLISILFFIQFKFIMEQMTSRQSIQLYITTLLQHYFVTITKKCYLSLSDLKAIDHS